MRRVVAGDALGHLEPDDKRELELLRTGLTSLAAACDQLDSGDLEARVGPLPAHPLLDSVRRSVNHFIDVADGYVRESAGTLAAAGEGRFHRKFLGRGMIGSFRGGAALIDSARAKLMADTDELARQRRERSELGHRIAEVSMHVASAASELSATADSLASSAQTAVDESADVLERVESLGSSSEEITQAAKAIHSLAAQTRLLALNATIEAGRAGEYGAGFTVVAGEVKALADQCTRVSETISELARNSQDHTRAAVGSVRRIAATIEDMDSQIKAIAEAAGGGGEATGRGLAYMSQTLHAEMAALTEG